MGAPTRTEIIARWRELCKNPPEGSDQWTWEALWAGLVIGAGRADLANYEDYMEFGFPEELKEE